MKIPRWKKLLSHLVPLTLEETGSEYNPELTVTLDRGRLQLLSGDAIYSWDDLYKNFLVAFDQLKMDERAIEEVLILGLGLGSVPYMLEKVFQQKYRYTAVEWDETVAELAAKYTLSRLSSPMDIVTADAEMFVSITEQTFDLIVADIFEDDLTPPQFETAEFLLSCEQLLRPGGLLLFNRLHGGSPAVKIVTERFFEVKFKAAFPDAWAIDTGGNWILCHQKKSVVVA
ncbi:MAG: methyltransferase domain-containing protein [Saprospiraceae bacterium]|nr:methyltransferase domain-containing protein [Saprospiraceae bacterium]